MTGVDLFEVLIDLSLDRAPRATPAPTAIKSAAIHFLLPPRGGRIVEIDGVAEIKADPDIHRLVVDDVVGKTVREPEDNNDFIGHVIAVDRSGRGARRKAEWAYQTLAVRME